MEARGAAILGGFFLLLGAAGGADCGSLGFAAAAAWGCAGLALMAAGTIRAKKKTARAKIVTPSRAA